MLALILAQAITAPPAAQTFPWEAVAINLLNGLQVLVIPLLIVGLRKGLTRIPRVSVPFIALALGVLTDGFLAWVASGGFSPLRGALMGLISVALREIVNTIREHGLES